MNSFAFRLDANSRYGIGHLMRCLAIAKALKQRGLKCHFVCEALDKNLQNLILDNEFLIFNVFSEQSALDAIKEINPNWLIIDHYYLDEKFEKKAKYFCENILVIDDLANRNHFCDILLDHGPLKTSKDYINLVNDSCQLCIGSKYLLIDNGFKTFKKQYSNRWKKGLVSFGGADYENITLVVLKILEKIKPRMNIEWTVLTGLVNPNFEGIKIFQKNSNLNLNLIKHTNKMPQLLAKHDFVIGAAGGMTWERSCIGIPSLSIPIAENQFYSIEVIKKFNLGETLSLDELIEKKVTICLKKLRKNASDILERNQSFVDGRGVDRLVDFLVK